MLSVRPCEILGLLFVSDVVSTEPLRRVDQLDVAPSDCEALQRDAERAAVPRHHDISHATHPRHAATVSKAPTLRACDAACSV